MKGGYGLGKGVYWRGVTRGGHEGGISIERVDIGLRENIGDWGSKGGSCCNGYCNSVSEVLYSLLQSVATSKNRPGGDVNGPNHFARVVNKVLYVFDLRRRHWVILVIDPFDMKL